MSEATNPRAVSGSNFPPLDPPDTVEARIEREHAALFVEAAGLESEAFALPDTPKTDAECATITDHVVRVRRIAKRLDDARTEFGRPYLDATRKINALFGELHTPLVEKKTGLADRLTERVGIYARAKEEAERAERLERERIEREKAEAARREEDRKRQEAEAAQRAADEAAARVRAAQDAESRRAAQEEMQRQETIAAAARKDADKAEEEAGKSERRADVQARAAEGPGLGRVSAAGSTSSVTKRWTHVITDADKLMASLGPLGAYLSNDTISQALARAVREAAAAGRADRLVLPGCRVFEESHTNVRAARA